MDDLGTRKANDQIGGRNDQGKGALSHPAEKKEPPSSEPQPLRDGNDVGKPPGTSYPVLGK